MIRRYVPIHALNPAERVTLLAAWVAGVAQGFAQSHATNTLPFSRLTFGLSEAEMANVLAITRAGALAALFVAMAADRRGRRLPLVVAFGVLVLSAGATGWADTAAQFTIAQTIMRGATTTAGALVVVLIAEVFRPGFRAFGMGIYAAAASLGAGLSLLLLPLAENAPEAWQTLFRLSLLGAVAIPFLLRIPAPPVPQVPRRAVWRPLAPPHAVFFWPIALASAGFAAFTAVQVGFAQERFINDLGLAATTVVPLSLTAGTLGGVGFFLGGSLADRLGRRPVSIGAYVLTLLGGLGMYFLSSLPLLFVAIFVASFGAFSAAPAAAAHRNELFPTEVRASAISWVTNVTVAGTVTGLAVAGVLIDRVGLSQTVLVLGLGIGIAIGLTAFLPETRGRILTQD
ncbi:MAG: MFS transporter [Acidimicrobiia bacterium]